MWRFRPLIFFPSVVTTARRRHGVCALDRLRVDDPGRRGRAAPFLRDPHLPPKPVVKPIKRPIPAPAREIPIHRLPRRQIPRQHPPRPPCTQQIQNRVHDLTPLMHPRTTTRPCGRRIRQQRLNKRPLPISQISRVPPLGCHTSQFEPSPNFPCSTPERVSKHLLRRGECSIRCACDRRSNPFHAALMMPRRPATWDALSPVVMTPGASAASARTGDLFGVLVRLGGVMGRTHPRDGDATPAAPPPQSRIRHRAAVQLRRGGEHDRAVNDREAGFFSTSRPRVREVPDRSGLGAGQV